VTDEQQPELRWAPLPPKPSNRGRVWLIVGLAVAALAILGVLLFFLVPRGEVAPDPTPSPSPSSTATPTPTPTPTATPTATAEPSEPPVQTEAPPVVDPSVDTFRDQISVWLGAAAPGLDRMSGLTGEDALSVVQTLEEDAQRMSSVVAPSSIGAQWSEAMATYGKSLSDLRTAVASGTGTSTTVSAAQAALQRLYDLVGY
jgi:hypothetical protein